jgi:glycerol-3-phosphate dehydrogenase
LSPVENTNTLWAELRWAANAEGIVHLDDLLLRRTRLGLLLPNGGKKHMDQIRHTIQGELGWDDDRWEIEKKNYIKLWEKCYHLGS